MSPLSQVSRRENRSGNGTSSSSISSAATYRPGVNAPLSDFSATINWGDGTTSAGTVIAQNGGGFAVTGPHTYAEEGSYQVGVTINDIGGSATTAVSTATVADAPHTINPSSNGVAMGQTLSVSAAKGVLANDSDPDDLTVEAVDGQTKAVGHAIEGKSDG